MRHECGNIKKTVASGKLQKNLECKIQQKSKGEGGRTRGGKNRSKKYAKTRN